MAVVVSSGLGAGILAGSASADSVRRCAFVPFTLGETVEVTVTPRPNGILAKWASAGRYTFDCPGMPELDGRSGAIG
jgi:hypothetical protein